MSIMITSATFFHAYYLFMYSYVMPEGVRNHISKRMNCEDIAMNFLVAHLTRRPPIKVKAPWKSYCPGCGRTLSSKGDHLERRHECMNVFAKEFGYMPLLYTAHTVESVPPEDGL
ncbi:hypothetical protein V1264_009802 [Littorina saxatilis]|uniref:Glycosyl transferase 64 domain-containing protein n=2 Tax=Littorina saxatilis TaxID=31220 RepID=A0AAN9AMW2_9CAEN